MTSAAIALTLFAAAGCAGASDGPSAGPADDRAVQDAQVAVDAAYEGTYSTPPSTASSPPEDKNVWVISCGQAVIGCSTPSDAAVEAVEAIGWNVNLYDGKLGADNAYADGVRQAVAGDADAIIIASIDCSLIKQPLAEAREAGVEVVTLLSYDCDDPRLGGGEPLYSASVIPNADEKTVSAYSIAQGKMKAQWAIAQTEGETVALSLYETDNLLGADIAKGFEEEIKACSSCRLVSLKFTLADIASGALPNKVSQALLKDPEINAVMTPYDSLLVLGVAQAIVRSGRNDEIASIGGEGYSPNLELIKNNGGQDAAIYESTEWFGWAAVDSLVRVFNDDAQEPAGIGSQLLDGDHFPETNKAGVVPPVDFKAAYLKAWGK
ncbi:hypothetical protein ASD81_19215 [Nocardioides sp. Root614]|nr:hypothetical protein ASD81_19215 [Nocardioides sp. Root614]KRA86768.1 hypothetical protein ASD84_21440 [Nocardioides sp. Root682]